MWYLGARRDGGAQVAIRYLSLRHLKFSPPLTCLLGRHLASFNGWITHDQLRQNYPVFWVDSIGGIIRVCSRRYVPVRSEEHTSELQSRGHLVCRLLLAKKNNLD